MTYGIIRQFLHQW